jgi:hypothetical protein
MSERDIWKSKNDVWFTTQNVFSPVFSRNLRNDQITKRVKLTVESTFLTPRTQLADTKSFPLDGISRTSNGSRRVIDSICLSVSKTRNLCIACGPPWRVGTGGELSRLLWQEIAARVSKLRKAFGKTQVYDYPQRLKRDGGPTNCVGSTHRAAREMRNDTTRCACNQAWC